MGSISESEFTQEDLVKSPGSHYSDLVFSWNPYLGITDLVGIHPSELQI